MLHDMQTDAQQSQLLRVRQAASELGASSDTVRRAIRSGELHAVRLGPSGSYRIHRRDLEAFLVDAEPRP